MYSCQNLEESYPMFDCMIVGAGPAGATAAYHLAKQGRSVAIVEQAALPRYKPCGGGVSPAIAEYFDFDLDPVISLKVNQLRYTWQLDDPVDVKLKEQEMLIVRRDSFDQFLVEQAQKQGATLKDNTPVTGIEWKSDRWELKTAQGTIEGRYLIAADGAKGPMAQWLKIKQGKEKLAGILQISGLSTEETPPLHFDFGSLKNGFIWNFPQSDGYGISATTFQGGDAKNLQETLQSYYQSSGLPGGTVQYHEHSVRLWDGDRPLHTQNALVAGEAAQIVDPLSGEGIRPSIFSGVKAAEAIDAALGGNSNALETYSQNLSEVWGADMKWAARISGVFYKLPKVSYRVGVKRPAASKVMSKILCGQLSYAEVAGAAIKQLGSGLFK